MRISGHGAGSVFDHLEIGSEDELADAASLQTGSTPNGASLELRMARQEIRKSHAIGRREGTIEPAVYKSLILHCGRGGTGRRARLRILWPKGLGGSSPSARTIPNRSITFQGFFGNCVVSIEALDRLPHAQPGNMQFGA
jgi:hypothetical protein